jgi:TetR/AcrR family transcriptional repressor of nem operon
MKVSREQATLNRERIVATAGRLFRERGYNCIGVADLMKSAGLTHGGFYGNFGSKEELLTEACQQALDESAQRWQKRIAAAPTPAAALNSITKAYLSPEHAADPGSGCAVAALGPELAREAPGPRHAVTTGIRQQLTMLQGLLQEAGEGDEADGARSEAIATYAAMVGALVLARTVDDGALSAEILAAVSVSLAVAP